MYREREYAQGRCGFESETRGFALHKCPQTQGSRPAFKSGHEENADADVGSASR